MPLELRIPARITSLGTFLMIWRDTSREAGLEDAKVFQVRIVHHGLEIKGH